MINLNHIEGLYNNLLQKYNLQIDENDSLQTEVSKVNSITDHHEQTTEKQVLPLVNTSSSEKFIEEYYERETCKILLSLTSHSLMSTMQHVNQNSVTEILSCTCPHVNTSNIKVVRLGKKIRPVNAGRPRSIKIVLEVSPPKSFVGYHNES